MSRMLAGLRKAGCLCADFLLHGFKVVVGILWKYGMEDPNWCIKSAFKHVQLKAAASEHGPTTPGQPTSRRVA